MALRARLFGSDLFAYCCATEAREAIIHKEFHVSNAETIAHYMNALGTVVARVVDDLQLSYPAAAVPLQKVAIVSATGGDMSRVNLVGDRRAA